MNCRKISLCHHVIMCSNKVINILYPWLWLIELTKPFKGLCVCLVNLLFVNTLCQILIQHLNFLGPHVIKILISCRFWSMQSSCFKPVIHLYLFHQEYLKLLWDCPFTIGICKGICFFVIYWHILQSKYDAAKRKLFKCLNKSCE